MYLLLRVVLPAMDEAYGRLHVASNIDSKKKSLIYESWLLHPTFFLLHPNFELHSGVQLDENGVQKVTLLIYW